MTDLPQWAMEKSFHAMDSYAIEHLLASDEHEATIQECIARALVEQDRIAEARGIERAAKVAAEYEWDDHALAQATDIGLAVNHQSVEIRAAIRKLMEQDNEQ